MPKKKNDNRNLIIALIVIFLLILLAALLIGIYYTGKSNGYSQCQTENNAKIQELNNKEKSLQDRAQDLARRESNLNNTEQTISSCYSSLQNATENYNDCKKKLDNPDLYIFGLNYSYNEINILIIAFLLIFPLRFTLVKIIVKNENIELFINIAAIIIFIIVAVGMGVD